MPSDVVALGVGLSAAAVAAFAGYVAILSLHYTNHEECVGSLQNFFAYKPTPTLCVASARIDGWGKWAGGVVLNAAMDAATTFGDTHANAWRTNVLWAKGVHVSGARAHFITQVEMATLYLRITLGAFVAISQVDIVLLACASSCLSTFLTTRTFLCDKAAAVGASYDAIERSKAVRGRWAKGRFCEKGI
jgi:hypothetical protein